MTDEEIDAMEAGRELDMYIVELVFGEIWFYTGRRNSPPAYSTDIAAAWQVVEKLTCTTKQWFHLDQHSTGCAAIFQNDDYEGYDAEADADTPALAICRAALRAMIGEGNNAKNTNDK